MKSTIANWSVNSNVTDANLTVMFYETNKTQTLNDEFALNINLNDNYTAPIMPTTKMVSKFSHILVIYNPLRSNNSLTFSIAYQ